MVLIWFRKVVIFSAYFGYDFNIALLLLISLSDIVLKCFGCGVE